jgi:hypothetical protein
MKGRNKGGEKGNKKERKIKGEEKEDRRSSNGVKLTERESENLQPP